MQGDGRCILKKKERVLVELLTLLRSNVGGVSRRTQVQNRWQLTYESSYLMLISSDFFSFYCRDGGKNLLHYLLHCTVGWMLWKIFPLERFVICHFEKVGAEYNLPGG